MKKWLIYGANGYTGQLIAQQAKQLGMTPIVAGRSASIHEVGARLGLAVRQFNLNNAAELAAGLADVQLVLHCAGPFSKTAEPMVRACLQAGAHYLDITGEFKVFEFARSLHDEAIAKGVVVCPGVGFDVIPTDCLALALKEALPEAVELTLGFDTASGLSPGTFKTLIETLADGGKIRRDGVLVTVPNAWRTRQIDFGFGPKSAMTIPWGDVSTAYFSTGIPNISVYFPAPRAFIRITRWTDWSRFIFGFGAVQRLLAALVDRRVKGPSPAQRSTLRTAVWGEVRDAKGRTRTARIETSNGYELTVHSALHVAQWVMCNSPAGGYYTPSQLMGWRLVEALPGSCRMGIQ